MRSKLSTALLFGGAMLGMIGCANPLPPPMSSPSESPTFAPSRSPSPSPSPSPELTLHVDGMVSVAVDGLRRFVDPAHPGKNSQLPRGYDPLRAGEVAFLVDGPLHVADRDYWQLMLDQFGPVPLGWAPVTNESGTMTLLPFQPTCPSVEGLSAAAISSLGGLQALVCLADREVTLRGEVECNRAIADGGVGGAYFLDSNRHCVLDALLPVYGDAVTAILGQDPLALTVIGAYELRGHMDDYGARGCGWIPMGVSHDLPTTPDPADVMWCRQAFVVTGLNPID